MRNLSTEQNRNAQKKSSPLQNYDKPRNATFPTSRHGSNHGTTYAQRVQRHSHDRRSRMLSRCNIPPMLDQHHRPRNSSSVFGQRLSMVRTPQQNYQRSRSAFHFAIWHSSHTTAT